MTSVENFQPACRSHALIFGASGITGWAVVNALLNDYPEPAAFDRVTALTNRPIQHQALQWPSSPKLQHVQGVNLLQGTQEELNARISANVPDVESITTVFFCAYLEGPDMEAETTTNTELLKRAISAVEALSPKLRFVMMTMGVKIYGLQRVSSFAQESELPLRETQVFFPAPFDDGLFYFHQLDLLKRLSAGKSWTYGGVIPDGVVGYAPHSFRSMAKLLAVYLSLYCEIHGTGATVAFPGTATAWGAQNSECSQDIVARFAIYASLHPEESGNGRLFNTADTVRPTTWAERWPILCEYFGLHGVGPNGGDGPGPDPGQFFVENRAVWVEVEKRQGLSGGHFVTDEGPVSGEFVSQVIFSMLDFDRQLDVSEMHRVWGSVTEEVDIRSSWYLAFDRMRAANIIP
ncbi:uncharacterized protein BO66DRAFT_433804 [Aspergillus aculeatinus CBS 121060]|uniref:Uncharacterized protein n=1 Tax=Aspergillus aculeatinus CBS 121060 TaxID=1448322 RepID=A0ACD1HMQ3_9EURO|nr:hypothetical protein BO66DRAFT_433804 [Aspergillus aculeatinus CBS 121060]RAH74695.1 hypothetical protein BO66DRAFT_433804 [Aspergillus aculeatinus CBS 121060]